MGLTVAQTKAWKVLQAQRSAQLTSSQMDTWAAFKKQDDEALATLKEEEIANKGMAAMDDATPQPVDDAAGADDAGADAASADDAGADDAGADDAGADGDERRMLRGSVQRRSRFLRGSK